MRRPSCLGWPILDVAAACLPTHPRSGRTLARYLGRTLASTWVLAVEDRYLPTYVPGMVGSLRSIRR